MRNLGAEWGENQTISEERGSHVCYKAKTPAESPVHQCRQSTQVCPPPQLHTGTAPTDLADGRPAHTCIPNIQIHSRQRLSVMGWPAFPASGGSSLTPPPPNAEWDLIWKSGLCSVNRLRGGYTAEGWAWYNVFGA